MAANPSSIPPNFPPTVPTRAPSTQLSMLSHCGSLQTTAADPSTVILRPLHQAPQHAYGVGGEVALALSGQPTEQYVQDISESQIETPEKETVKSKFDEKVSKLKLMQAINLHSYM